MKRGRVVLVLAAAALFAFAPLAEAAVKVNWWYALGGPLGEKIVEISKKFNASQSEYEVVATYKGNYTETMTAAIAAFRAKQQPHIVQIFEVGTATMMAAKGAIMPVYQLMAEAKEPFDQSKYLQAVIGYYTTPDGKMLSMPFNSSTAVFYYNKEAFKTAGLDPNKPPKTWPEVAEYSKKIVAAYAQKAAGVKAAVEKAQAAKAEAEKKKDEAALKKANEELEKTKAGIVTGGFSGAWQGWVHIENFSAWHNVPIGTKSNGFEGLDTEFKFNSPLHAKHIQAMADWQKENIFRYGGRISMNALPLFVNGEVAMFTDSSASYATIKRGAKFDFGVAMLPYWPDAPGAPQNSIIGGATLWVMSGHKPEEYKGVAKFFTFLSSPEIQADWHQFTGYVPITNAAYELTQKQGFYDKNPGTDVAIKQLNNKPPTANSKGLRFGSYVQVRDIIDEELEAAWAGKKTGQQALDDIVKRGNELLRKFQEANK